MRRGEEMNVCSRCLWTDEDQELALLTDNISPTELMDYDALGFMALLLKMTIDDDPHVDDQIVEDEPTVH